MGQVLSTYAKNGGFQKSESFEVGEYDLKCQESRNAEGVILEFCLHPRGHDMRKEYFIRAWEKVCGAGRYRGALGSVLPNYVSSNGRGFSN